MIKYAVVKVDIPSDEELACIGMFASEDTADQVAELFESENNDDNSFYCVDERWVD
jgi:hypothetical protein